jgi:cold shock protein
MTVNGTVREWHDEYGWGVIDSAETPGGCWAHFSVLEVPGFRTLLAGQAVRLEWESGWQDGDDFRALRVQPLKS